MTSPAATDAAVVDLLLRLRKELAEQGLDLVLQSNGKAVVSGHNWANAIAMATPIAHKGATAAAKATRHDVVSTRTAKSGGVTAIVRPSSVCWRPSAAPLRAARWRARGPRRAAGGARRIR